MLLANICTRYEFALLLGIELKELTYVLYVEKVDNLYTTFSIPKKSGGERQINAPKKKLKYIQRRLKVVLEAYAEEIYKEHNLNTDVSHAFRKGKSIITNAKVHRNKKFVINIDLENFFDSFNFGRVRGFFIKNKYWNLNPDIATLIAQVTCYKGALPQGAPTSPLITNLICNVMDWHITKLAQKYRLKYTRYADDLTFTTNDKHIVERYDAFLTQLTRELEKCGFKINESKTRFTDYKHRQEVTGLVVNEKVSVNREYYRNTYAMAHSLYCTGKFVVDGKDGTLNQLEGRLSFIDQLDKYNNKIDEKTHNVWNLSHREKKYQEFLFYKYFCANSKPLIITEGKTDIIYLKIALRSMMTKYPNLVCVKDGNIEYGVSFLKRSDRLDYFFNIKQEGASSITNVWKWYCGSDPFNVSYYDHFMNNYKVKPLKPVILLYDNEMNNNDKPIKQLINSKIGQNIDKEELRRGTYVNLLGNLYVQVVPLVKGKEECEIEDLITENVDQLVIDGRLFDRKGKKSKDKYFNKDVLSHHIESHENEFHFDCFGELFDTWDKIVKEYCLSIR